MVASIGQVQIQAQIQIQVQANTGTNHRQIEAPGRLHLVASIGQVQARESKEVKAKREHQRQMRKRDLFN